MQRQRGRSRGQRGRGAEAEEQLQRGISTWAETEADGLWQKGIVRVRDRCRQAGADGQRQRV